MADDFRDKLRQTPALAGVLSFMVVLETAVVHLVLFRYHPWIAWTMTLSSASVLVWIWTRRKRA